MKKILYLILENVLLNLIKVSIHIVNGIIIMYKIVHFYITFFVHFYIDFNTNLWKKYKRTKTEEDKVKIYDEIEGLQPQIKVLYSNKQYCEGIYKRSIEIQNNTDNFDKDVNIIKEKNNIRN